MPFQVGQGDETHAIGDFFHCHLPSDLVLCHGDFSFEFGVRHRRRTLGALRATFRVAALPRLEARRVRRASLPDLVLGPVPAGFFAGH